MERIKRIILRENDQRNNTEKFLRTVGHYFSGWEGLPNPQHSNKNRFTEILDYQWKWEEPKISHKNTSQYKETRLRMALENRINMLYARKQRKIFLKFWGKIIFNI